MAGDLTSAFDFRKPNAAIVPLPNTAAYQPPNYDFHPNDAITPPPNQAVPMQEPGVRRARALPYALHVHGKVNAADSTFQLEFHNVGGATAVFHVRTAHGTLVPRSYTVEPGKRIDDGSPMSADGIYELAVHGPNGFFRSFRGGISGRSNAVLKVACDYLQDDDEITLAIANLAVRAGEIHVTDRYSGETFQTLLAPRKKLSKKGSRCVTAAGTTSSSRSNTMLSSSIDWPLMWRMAGTASPIRS